MPVKHDLLADLKLNKEELAQHRSKDPRLHQLLDQYDNVDKEVLAAESALAADGPLRTLKERRLKVKKQIVERLRGL
ncbi:hypothetical protein [Pseudomonas batumici]|uniref:DUF465 domain-containing protein n=1 Tax=Pseudomonas batumici TaxID=226910 RepID=A0A0C2IEH6_9PSED|nr:hypothetical protein [Pseudomonas batumici]KIH83377.1 hypothetical protein UCMB321_2873 [Pseudomonas batumici]